MHFCGGRPDFGKNGLFFAFADQAGGSFGAVEPGLGGQAIVAEDAVFEFAVSQAYGGDFLQGLSPVTDGFELLGDFAGAGGFKCQTARESGFVKNQPLVPPAFDLLAQFGGACPAHCPNLAFSSR